MRRRAATVSHATPPARRAGTAAPRVVPGPTRTVQGAIETFIDPESCDDKTPCSASACRASSEKCGPSPWMTGPVAFDGQRCRHCLQNRIKHRHGPEAWTGRKPSIRAGSILRELPEPIFRACDWTGLVVPISYWSSSCRGAWIWLDTGDAMTRHEGKR